MTKRTERQIQQLSNDQRQIAAKRRLLSEPVCSSISNVNSNNDGVQRSAQSVALPGEKSLTAWIKQGGSNAKILGQKYNADDTKDGNELILLTGEGDIYYLDLFATSQGGFAISFWDSKKMAVSIFDASGNLLRTNVLDNAQMSVVPKVVELNGKIYTTYRTSNNEIYLNSYNLDGTLHSSVKTVSGASARLDFVNLESLANGDIKIYYTDAVAKKLYSQNIVGTTVIGAKF